MNANWKYIQRRTTDNTQQQTEEGRRRGRRRKKKEEERRIYNLYYTPVGRTEQVNKNKR